MKELQKHIIVGITGGIGSGKTRTESNDANDFFELNLKPGIYTVTLDSTNNSSNMVFEKSKSTTLDFQVKPEANQIIQFRVIAK